LPTLVGSEADLYDREIAGLIAEAQVGHDIGDELLAVLRRSPIVHDWAARVLENDRHLPPDIQRITDRSYQSLPGQGEPVEAERYECPYGDYVWYRISISDPVPSCQTHKCVLKAS
jgi:hypothetical protein